jgi:bifunctional DNase/RNase
MSREQFILMTVGGLTLDPVTKTPIVILRDSENKLNLPIWIGLLEATAMATELEGIKMARPMTHDLLRSVLDELGASVDRIEVTELRDNTYYALVSSVLQKMEETPDQNLSNVSRDKWAEILEKMGPDDFKYKM